MLLVCKRNKVVHVMVCVLEVVIPLVSILVIFCVIRLVKDGVRPTAMKHVLGRANALALVLVRKYVIVVITVVLLAVREHVLVHVVVDVRAVMVGALAHVMERVLVHVKDFARDVLEAVLEVVILVARQGVKEVAREVVQVVVIHVLV